MELPLPELNRALDAVGQPVVFATVSGSHLYGFPSVDSDHDLRGSHLLPGAAFWALDEPRETLETRMETEAGLVETVSHDLRKFARLLLKKNGYVLEQLTSPLGVRSSAAHRELLALVPGVLTRNHYYHYRGFYGTERKEYDRSEPRSVKKLLYCYRVLMTGIVLLREGRVEANLPALNERFGLRAVPELIERKVTAELAGLEDDAPYLGPLAELETELDRAFRESSLPELPPAREELNRLVVRVREQGPGAVEKEGWHALPGNDGRGDRAARPGDLRATAPVAPGASTERTGDRHRCRGR